MAPTRVASRLEQLRALLWMHALCRYRTLSQTTTLGKLKISDDGIRERDELVTENFFSKGIPLCGVLGGGYNKDFRKLVEAEIAAVSLDQRLMAIKRWMRVSKILGILICPRKICVCHQGVLPFICKE